MKMRGCEDEKMFYRPPLLEEPCAQTLSGMRKSRRIASFLMLSSSKIEDVSQNCCVFDVVKFKN